MAENALRMASVGASAALMEPALVTLLPFGATDIRIGVMPATWQ